MVGKKSKGSSTLLIIFLILSLLAAVILFTRKTKKDSTPVLPEPNTSKVEETSEPRHNTKFTLYRSSNGMETDVFTVLMGNIKDNVAPVLKWGKFLIFENTNIFIQDTTTGKTDELVHIADYPIFKGKRASIRLITKPIIYENILFFSLGEYFTDGGSYWIDLAGDRKANLITEEPFSDIKKDGDYYWLITGQGDGPWNVKNYRIFDIDTKKLSDAFKFSTSPNTKENKDLLLIDSKENRLIVYVYDRNEDSAEPEDPYWYSYTNSYIEEINYLNGKNKVLIPKGNPALSKALIEVDEDNMRIYIHSRDRAYVFDLDSQELKDLGGFSNMGSIATSQVRSDMACIYLIDNKGYTGVSLSDTDNPKLNPPECVFSSTENSRVIQLSDAENFFKSLNLPSEYYYKISY